MLTTGTLVAALDDDLRAETDIDLKIYDALLHVFESRDAGIQMTDLAREIALTKAGLTAMVDRPQ